MKAQKKAVLSGKVESELVMWTQYQSLENQRGVLAWAHSTCELASQCHGHPVGCEVEVTHEQK